MSWILGLLLLASQHAQMGMGFDQDKTMHHFILTESGGYVDVSVKSKTDTKNRDAIRSHFRHISMEFKEGNFDAPLMVHGETPDGVETMRRLRADIQYSFSETPVGARLTIGTKSKDALAAIHAFLRYQIREHKTGDPTTVQATPSSERPKPPAKPARPGTTTRR